MTITFCTTQASSEHSAEVGRFNRASYSRQRNRNSLSFKRFRRNKKHPVFPFVGNFMRLKKFSE
jgi:hypothetical protein